ncbi:hypothetical protein [Roseateles amylovorans]|uniref:Hemerythrin-like domain-containing protein n=1 Tax=Roseateles amylovorans TaxID=2978473 RepID=A0ABY6B3M3_9BURK|nr:hypothetical protein [Roseateles amylovorans]UXH79981.1 hypothetical protein N4261_08915 [Roseateles amylovorans]
MITSPSTQQMRLDQDLIAMLTDACKTLRITLLDLHRSLVDLERRQYEKQHGQQGAGDFLQVMAYAEEMRWLEPLSRLIVMLDEALDGDGDSDATPLMVAQRARELISLDRESTEAFMARYAAHFDASPALVGTHARVVAALKAVGTTAVG